MAPPRLTRGPGVELEVILTLVVLLVLAGAAIRARPFVRAAPADEHQLASAPPTTAAADVVVVLPTVAEAHNFDQLSHDQAWLNVIEREVGPFQAVESAQLTRFVLDPRAWVVIPRRAAGQLDPAQTQFIRNWVEDGGTLILEQPEGPWRGLVGQQFTAARTRETRRITSFDGALSRGEMRADILETPLRTTLAAYNPPALARGREYQVIMEIDGQPAIATMGVGRGHVVLLLFDLARFIVHTTQGVPADDFTITARSDAEPAQRPTVSSDLIAHDSLRQSKVPYVDLLERNVLYLLDVHRPIPRLWSYPSTYRGALLVVHSEARYGDRAAYMTSWEQSEEQRSTVYAVPGSLTPEALARLGRTGTNVELQWVPPGHAHAPSKTWGIRQFQPVRRSMNFIEQLDALNADLFPYGPVVASRSLDGLWTDRYFDGFRMLEAAGVALDSSYGPAAGSVDQLEGQIGYVFGTGQPFRPLDQSGNRFNLRELPTTVDASSAAYSLQWLRQLIVDSSDGYHSTIVADWRPDIMATRPSFDAIEGWQQSFELAESQEIWVSTVAEYADFLARREASHVESSFSREERRLGITARLIGPSTPTEATQRHTPSIAFPARFDGRPVERLVVDHTTIQPASLSLTGDRVLHILPLEPGEHRIQVYYGSPIDLGQVP